MTQQQNTPQPRPAPVGNDRTGQPGARGSFRQSMTRTVGTAMLPALFFGSDAWGQIASPVVDDEVITTGRVLAFDELNALRAPTPVINVPQSLSLVGEEQIADQFFTDFGDVLRYTPGLAISQGEGHRDAIVIRGQQTTADFFIDGLRDDVQYFRPLYNVEQIEILRGPNALLFGRGGTGGIINRVQKSADVGESFNAGVVSVDTFGSALVSADSNIATGERSALRLNAFAESLDNHRDNVDGERWGINPTFAFQPSPDTRVDLSYEYLDDDRTVDRGVPSVTVASGPAGEPLRPLEGFSSTFFGSPDANFTTLEAHITRARVDHRWSDMLRGNATIQYADYSKLYQNLYPSEAVTLLDGAPVEVELDGYRDTTERQNLILQGNLVGELDWGSVHHTVISGVEYADQSTSNARVDNVFAANGDDQLSFAFTDPLSIPAFAFTDPARDRKSDVDVLSVYIQDQVDIGEHFQVVLGGRYDRFSIDVDDRANDGEFSRTDGEFSPRLGAIYKPQSNVSLYASYGESFLPRSGDQFLTLDLDTESTRPQRFENLEAGLKWDLRPDLHFTAAAFRLDRESFTSVDPEDQSQLIVIDGSRVDGVEAQLTGQLTSRWSTSLGYSYLDGRVDSAGALDGNRTRQTPEHMVSAWNRYQATPRFGLGLGATYQSSFFVREDNRVEVLDFLRFDAAAYYAVSDAVELQMNIENLFDTDYFPDAHSNTNISTGAPLNARFTVRGLFN